MRDLKFERIAQLIAIGAVERGSTPLSLLSIKEQTLRVRFSDYVKSQIHLNIVQDFYGRGINEYVEALLFLNGDPEYRSSVENVLRYFYLDMSKFLINNSENVTLVIIIDTDLLHLPEKSINLEQIKADFLDVLAAISGGGEADVLRKFKYSFIFDDVMDADDAAMKADSYALAAVLSQSASEEPLTCVKLEETDDFKI